MTFFDDIVHVAKASAKKAIDEATEAAADISHGDIIGAAEHVENIREIPRDIAVDVVKTTINGII